MAHTAVGQLHIINYTGVAWNKKGISSQGMEKWDFSFPEKIAADSTAVVQVEFVWSLFRPLENDVAQVTYELEGTGKSLIIHATGRSGQCEVYVDYNDVPVLTSSAVDWILNPSQPASALPPKFNYNLRWGSGETQDYVLELHRSTVQGFYTNNVKMGLNFSIDSASWMSQYYAFLKDTPLNQILIPGTQDSGCTEVVHTSQYGVCNANFITQVFNLEEQLRFGARFFDLKPCYRESKWRLGHYYKHTPEKTFGGEGISLDEMITTINQFTQNHNELIVLYINDPTIITNRSYSSTIDHFQSLFYELRELNFLYKDAPVDVKNLTNLPLSAFLENSQATETKDPSTPSKPQKACVLIVLDETSSTATAAAAEMSKNKDYPGISIPPQSGIFSTKERFPMNVSRSLFQEPIEVVNEQLANLDSSPVPEPLHPSNRMVLMNWSTIQSTNDAFWTGLGLWNGQCSILNQAQKMRYLLHTLFTSMCSLRDRYPNIIMVDGYDDSVLRCALTINLLQGLKRFQKWSEAGKRPFYTDSQVGRLSIAAAAAATPTTTPVALVAVENPVEAAVVVEEPKKLEESTPAYEEVVAPTPPVAVAVEAEVLEDAVAKKEEEQVEEPTAQQEEKQVEEEAAQKEDEKQEEEEEEVRDSTFVEQL